MSMSMSSTKSLPNETFLKKYRRNQDKGCRRNNFPDTLYCSSYVITYDRQQTRTRSCLPCRHNQISPTKHVGTKQNLHNTKIYTTQSNIFLTRMNYKIYHVRLFRILYLNMQQNRRQIQPVVYFDYIDYIETIVLSLMDSVLEIGRQ